MITLGICIPTYKRPAFLRRCVLSAINSAEGRPIRIFIADDSVTDANDTVLSELTKAYPSVQVHRNLRNLGIDANIQQVVELCDCDYAWLVGEDDYFLTGAVKRMHDLLQDVDAPFVFANYAYVGDDAGKIIGQALSEPDGELPTQHFISSHLWAAGFIGACVVDRHRWSSTQAVPYEGSYYTHVGRICELLAQSNASVYVVAGCSVANRVEGTDTFTWKRDSYGVFFGFKAMCEAVARQHPALAEVMLQAAAGMERKYGWLTLRLAIRLRSESGYDISQYRRYLRYNIESVVKRLAFLIISVTPPILFRPLVRLYRSLRSKSDHRITE